MCVCGLSDLTWSCMGVVEGLVVEEGSVDALAPTPVLSCDVSPLDHEVRHTPVDLRSLVAELRLQSTTHIPVELI